MYTQVLAYFLILVAYLHQSDYEVHQELLWV